jgi:type VI secretion system protein ImpF
MLKQPGAPPTVSQSVLDRLIDMEPKASSEVPLTRAESMRQIKQGLRRDLECLLNTRRVAVAPGDDYRELNRSGFMYGTPDLNSFSVSNAADRERLQRAIATVVRLFEPRIANPKVVKLEDENSTNHALRFRIEGLLRTEPVQRISFDTILQVANGEYEVKGEPDAG